MVGRGLRSATCPQVELSELRPLLRLCDPRGGSVEMARDVEDATRELAGRGAREQGSPNGEVRLDSLLGEDEVVRDLPDVVVEEAKLMIHQGDEPSGEGAL